MQETRVRGGAFPVGAAKREAVHGVVGIRFMTAYLPLSRRTMPSISSWLSLIPSSSVH